MAIERQEILRRLRRNIERGIPIIGTGAGTGISAKCEELGGTDLIIVYNSGRFRMAGIGSTAGCLPLGDANTIMMELGREVIPVVKDTPVIAGVFGNDPFRNMKNFLQEVKYAGFSGIQNYPTIANYDGNMRREFEQTGFKFDNEVEMVRIAREMDLLTTPYAWQVEEAEKMARAGADVIVAHCGCTTGGTTGMEWAPPLEDAAGFVQEVCDAAKAINPEVIVMCHGGPISSPEDAEFILQHTRGVAGFYGASSAERLPVEQAIPEQIRRFKAIKYEQKIIELQE